MLELVRRAYKRMVMLGKHPTKIMMTQEFYDMLEVEAAQQLYSKNEKANDYSEIFGMRIEVRNDMDNNWMFYIS